VTTAYIGLESGTGDSPGYIREGLARIGLLGALRANSDLYISRKSGAAEEPRYTAVAKLQTALSHNDLLKQLRAIESELDGATAPGGRRKVDLALLLTDPPSTSEGTEIRNASLLLPLSEFTTELRLTPAGAELASSIASLSHGELSSIKRIRDTAQLRQPAAIDYDAPNGASSDYDRLRPFSAFSLAVFDELANLIALRPGMRVLDVGCGTGRFSELFAARGAHVTGLDKSKTMLAGARKNNSSHAGSIRYVHGDANSSMPAGPFEVATYFFSVQYMSLVPAFWEALNAVLTSDGMVAFVTFPHRHFVETDLTKYFPGIPRVDLARFPSVPALTGSMRENGMRDIVVREVVYAGTTPARDYVTRAERKYVSTLHLLDEHEYCTGIESMKKALAGRETVEINIRSVIVTASRPY